MLPELRIDRRLPFHHLFTPRILVISDMQNNLIKVQQRPQVRSFIAITNAKSQYSRWNGANHTNICQDVWQIGRIVSLITV